MTQQRDPNVRLLRDIALTTVLWATTFVISKNEWFAEPRGMPLRVALVVMGIGGFLPVVFVYARSIRMQDEFNQRMHLVALSIAFATIAVLSYAADLVRQAGFISHVPGAGLWALMVGVWFISMLLTSRYYR